MTNPYQAPAALAVQTKKPCVSRMQLTVLFTTLALLPFIDGCENKTKHEKPTKNTESTFVTNLN